MSVFTIVAFQGQATSQVIDLNPTSAFQGNEILTASISSGGTAAAIATITPTWAPNQIAGQYQFVLIALSAQDTASLAPGYYALSVALFSSAAQLAWGLLEIVSSPSNQPSQDFLADPSEVVGLLPPNLVSSTTIVALPRLISSATQAIRRFCMDRYFTRQIYTDTFPVALNGYIRLPQIPINQVLRVQSHLDPALTIANSRGQFAQAIFSFAGDVSTGVTIDGITLNWTLNGMPGTRTVQFTANETINALASAINAVGQGWSAGAENGYGLWPVTELYGGMTGTGVGQNAKGETVFQVFSEDISNAQFHPDDGNKTGLLWVGEMSRGIGPTWGPDPIDYDYGAYGSPNIVKVTYDGGFSAIPSFIVFACVETVKAMLHRLQLNPYLSSERAGEVSQSWAIQALHSLPQYVLEELSQYRLHNA